MDNNSINQDQSQNLNSKADVQMPNYILPSSNTKKSKLIIPLILFIILAAAGIGFGIYEFINNSSLKSEVADLKSKIEALENPQKPEEPEEKMYSGLAEREYDEHEENGVKVRRTVSVDYNTGELSISTITCSSSTDCQEKVEKMDLTEKELTKLWLITRDESAQDIYISSVYTASLEPNKGDNLEAVYVKLMKNDGKIESKEEAGVNWSEIAGRYDADGDGIFTFREYADFVMDEMLYKIYGGINCMPSICDGDCKNLDDKSAEGGLTCSIAEKIGYRYVAY